MHRLLLIAFYLALPVAAHELTRPQQVTSPALTSQVMLTHFFSKEDARKALTEGAEKAYFDTLYLGEMRAKTGLAFRDASVEEAREQTRQHYADQVQDFTDGERAALEGVLARLRPDLESKAPLYARTQWTFLKVTDKVEGGLPHTRANYVVLPASMLHSFAQLHAARRMVELDAFAANLLVHEQTHVLERRQPELFASLFTGVFGFSHMSPMPTAPWLLDRGIVNPDAPDCGWAFPLTEGKQIRWIMPYLQLRDTKAPRMPDDFEMVGITVEEKGGRWSVVGTESQPRIEALASFKQYTDAFPNPDEYYHPNEIAADILAGWITGNGDGDINHPLRAKTAAWAVKNLR